MSQRIFFCFSAGSDSLREDLLCCIVAADINFRRIIVVQNSVFLYTWQWRVVQQHTECVVTLHCNDGYTNASLIMLHVHCLTYLNFKNILKRRERFGTPVNVKFTFIKRTNLQDQFCYVH